MKFLNNPPPKWLFRSVVSWVATLIVLVGLQVATSCGNQTPGQATCKGMTTCNAPEAAPINTPATAVNAVEVTLTGIKGLDSYGGASVPDKCIEFDYYPTRNMPDLNPIADLDHTKCRMLWCGTGSAGGMATLWCH